MKKNIIIILALMCFTAMNQAIGQCKKSGQKSACCNKISMAGNDLKGASYFASLNDQIIEKKAVSTGEVSYFEKSECAYSGNISLKAVVFDDKLGKFVSASQLIHSDIKCTMVCTPEQIAKCKAMGIKCTKKQTASLAIAKPRP